MLSSSPPPHIVCHDPAVLIQGLRESRAHLSRVTAHLTGDRLLGPYLTIVNPPLWELGHVAWFQEFWCLRQSSDGRVRDSVMPSADALYDSARVAHATRWDLPLPDLSTTRAYQNEVLSRIVARLGQEPENAGLHYFVLLATFHEDMHAEAFRYTCQTLGYEDPLADGASASDASVDVGADVEMPGGLFPLGSPDDGRFVFDNEKWAHEVKLRPFRISRQTVSNQAFLDFVSAGGYGRREWWSDEGWNWVQENVRSAPCYWTRRDGVWHQRRFDRVEPLAARQPVVHVNWHEAQAYCAFAQRRLPTEAEWEYAAAYGPAGAPKREYPWGSAPPDASRANLESAGLSDVGACKAGDTPLGCRQMLGNIWEWTASTFGPYPGFAPDPYKEYSEPWFATHKVLRGGSFATPRRLIRNAFRNFYLPERSDVLAGFRTCAL